MTQESIYEQLQRSKYSQISKLRQKRLDTLSDNLAELEKYFQSPKCPKQKKSTLARMIERYNNLLARLTRYNPVTA